MTRYGIGRSGLDEAECEFRPRSHERKSAWSFELEFGVDVERILPIPWQSLVPSVCDADGQWDMLQQCEAALRGMGSVYNIVKPLTT